jgi:predicted SprT family Zn-dependent metalloprotease
MEKHTQPIEFRFGKRGEAASYNIKTDNIRINLRYIDSIEHLYQLIEHEVIHKVLNDEKFKIEKEHVLIDKTQWAYYLIS